MLDFGETVKLRERPGRAFTLIELLIVVAIIGILSGVLLTVLNPGRFQKRARDTRRKSDLGAIQTAVEMYYSENGDYPASVPFGSQWSAGGITYLKSVPQDPLSTQSYCYEKTGTSGYILCAKPELSISGGTTTRGSTCTSAYGYCVTNPF
ncbi:prepilin-type N-terminal cleavage/methylation domain-containing protein [Candidatus Parcubacteria bacterium]|nr:prepilin-type N-terminal cleavage/methylation domain-containing protein [Candidatus Parcubacteria bacterium]